ncbi:GDYXXLXY domain-containing protein [Glaciimonas sp. CA11.2]|uniref:GDYXXLXY domain-containing protein n=1 Tax=unclassified Glaciimonas TaxID=2644401 RepID=UPI002AB4CEAA|nr:MULTISPECIES: GDYXXLXY domain-containing protein [unclassified Glaciimonas]MDY7544980.1 GDYXXLXY domain-containing protein [Glaciimonas sp. CA11.2]MEB0013283.1 GDYXXLXY domain-containing protein [Glaciimonas sp. Cout2]MEB0082476.1 GDYXXLXY domain-containing protein [Glaciimonas sp. Gout2]MEB0164116.1 GDYXXLXY domain-containing protein [Glaciimonas sp. CA11.2]
MFDRSIVKSNRGGLILIGLMLILAAINQAIWHKEEVLKYGRSVSLAMAPVDPRSLMQGDYMALDWQLSRDIMASSLSLPITGKAVISVPDESGQIPAKFVRIDNGKPLAANEALIEYRLRNGRVRVVSDAYFFQEGQGAAFANARYGQFRVASDGQALLVGLQDDQMRLIHPSVQRPAQKPSETVKNPQN